MEILCEYFIVNLPYILRDPNECDILIMREYTILLMLLTRVSRFALAGCLYKGLPCTLVKHPSE